MTQTTPRELELLKALEQADQALTVAQRALESDDPDQQDEAAEVCGQTSALVLSVMNGADG